MSESAQTNTDQGVWLAVKDMRGWEPALEINGATFGLGLWFASEALCEVWIADNVLPARASFQ